MYLAAQFFSLKLCEEGRPFRLLLGNSRHATYDSEHVTEAHLGHTVRASSRFQEQR